MTLEEKQELYIRIEEAKENIAAVDRWMRSLDGRELIIAMKLLAHQHSVIIDCQDQLDKANTRDDI
jgi:hypothetical protein